MVDNLVHRVVFENVLHQLHYFRAYLLGLSVQEGCENFRDVACQSVVDFSIEVGQKFVDQGRNFSGLDSFNSF